MGCDSRIGQKYLKGALGYGGPCFPRDNIAFSALARDNGAPALLAEATDALNKRQVPRLAKSFCRTCPKAEPPASWGSPTSRTPKSSRNRRASRSRRHCCDAGVRVVVYDPAAMENAKQRVDRRRDLRRQRRGMRGAGGCSGDHHALARISGPAAGRFQRTSGTLTVLDCWRVLPADRRDRTLPEARQGRQRDFSVAAGMEKLPREGSAAVAGRAWVRLIIR